MPMPLLLLLLLRRRASAVFWVRFGFETFVEIGMRSERRERRKGRGERRQGRIGASLIRKSSGSQFFLYPRFYLARDALGLERLQDGAGGHLGGSERERSSKTGSGGRGDERTRGREDERKTQSVVSILCRGAHLGEKNDKFLCSPASSVVADSHKEPK